MRSQGHPGQGPGPGSASAPAVRSPTAVPVPSDTSRQLAPNEADRRHRLRTVRRGGSAWRDLDNRLLGVLGRLTERDRRLCRLLDEHRVLTTAQIADALFSGARRARMRLGDLYGLEVLDRFRPRSGSAAPFHWVLGPLGTAVVAAEQGIDPGGMSWRRRLATDLAATQRLDHLVGTNGFFCSLLRSARTSPGRALEVWWSEQRCAREWGEVVRPDGYGIWIEDATSLPFLYEHDNGTERLERLARKLDGYARLARAAGHPSWVLFSFASPRRESDAAAKLRHPVVPVATCTRRPGVGPDGAVWQPVGSSRGRDGGRLRLVELAGAGPFAR